MLALPGCTVFGRARPVVLATSAPCTPLVPSQWTAKSEDGGGVQHTPDPEPAPAAPAKPVGVELPTQGWVDYWKSMYQWAFGEQKKWINFGISESQKVEDANGRTRDAVVGIISTCEARDAAAIAKGAH